jgi:hypothetical protein
MYVKAIATIACLTLTVSLLHAADSTTVWAMKNGIVKVEAESYSPTGWEERTEKIGFSGESYLQWRGGTQTLGDGWQPADLVIGKRSDWIVLTFAVEKKSTYRIDLKMRHEAVDGDNDIWVRYPETDGGWHKVGSKDGSARGKWGFTGWTYGENPIELEPGIHTAYITGRSNDFCLDYIAIYDTRGEEAGVYGEGQFYCITEQDRRMVEQAPVSEPYDPTETLHTPAIFRGNQALFRATGLSYTLDGRRVQREGIGARAAIIVKNGSRVIAGTGKF